MAAGPGWWFTVTSGFLPTGASLSISKWRLREIGVYLVQPLGVNPTYSTFKSMDRREASLRCNFTCGCRCLTALLYKKRVTFILLVPYLVIFAIYVCNIDYFLIQFFEETLPPLPLRRKRPWLYICFLAAVCYVVLGQIARAHSSFFSSKLGHRAAHII